MRVWSTDWWFNAEEAIERLDQALNVALTESRANSLSEASKTGASAAAAAAPFADGRGEEAPTIEVAPSIEPNSAAVYEANDRTDFSAPSPLEIGERRAASPQEVTAASRPGFFATTDLSTFKADPDRFFEFAYRPTIQDMVDAIMNTEAPVRDDVLAQRVARAHGWLRTGARIREQIALHLRALDRTEETSGTFLWKPGTVSARVPFRKPHGPDHRRSLAEICIAELADFIVSHPSVLDEDDPPLVYARLMQVERLAAPSRERLIEAIALARTLGV